MMPDALHGALLGAMPEDYANRNARTYGRTDVELGYGGDQSFRSVMGAQKADLASIWRGSATQTTPPTHERTAVLSRGECRYCHRPVVWGLLQSGYHRAFQPKLVPTADVAERDRYGVHRRLGRVVDLNGVTNPPPSVLVAHMCTEYAEALRMRGLSKLSDALETLLTRRPA